MAIFLQRKLRHHIGTTLSTYAVLLVDLYVNTQAHHHANYYTGIATERRARHCCNPVLGDVQGAGLFVDTYRNENPKTDFIRTLVDDLMHKPPVCADA